MSAARQAQLLPRADPQPEDEQPQDEQGQGAGHHAQPQQEGPQQAHRLPGQDAGHPAPAVGQAPDGIRHQEAAHPQQTGGQPGQSGRATELQHHQRPQAGHHLRPGTDDGLGRGQQERVRGAPRQGRRSRFERVLRLAGAAGAAGAGAAAGGEGAPLRREGRPLEADRRVWAPDAQREPVLPGPEESLGADLASRCGPRRRQPSLRAGTLLIAGSRAARGRAHPCARAEHGRQCRARGDAKTHVCVARATLRRPALALLLLLCLASRRCSDRASPVSWGRGHSSAPGRSCGWPTERHFVGAAALAGRPPGGPLRLRGLAPGGRPGRRTPRASPARRFCLGVPPRPPARTRRLAGRSGRGLPGVVAAPSGRRRSPPADRPAHYASPSRGAHAGHGHWCPRNCPPPGHAHAHQRAPRRSRALRPRRPRPNRGCPRILVALTGRPRRWPIRSPRRIVPRGAPTHMSVILQVRPG